MTVIISNTNIHIMFLCSVATSVHDVIVNLAVQSYYSMIGKGMGVELSLIACFDQEQPAIRRKAELFSVLYQS